MARFNTVHLAIAAVAVLGVLLTVAAFECDVSMVGRTYPFINPLYYYTCIDPTTPKTLPCPPNSGYISNGTMTGCVPWQLWTCTSNAAPPACSASCVGYLFPTANPQTYYECIAVGKSELLSCPSGTAFNPRASTNNVTVGCINWTTWSSVCPY